MSNKERRAELVSRIEFVLAEFYNHCHGKGGLFCETPASGAARIPGWSSEPERKITVKKSFVGSTVVDGVRAKAVYETTTTTGDKVRLFDQTGDAKSYAAEMLKTQARLQEQYPKVKVKGIIVTDPDVRDSSMPYNSQSVSRYEFARVNSNYPYTLVNHNHLGFDIKASDNFNMPSSQTGDTKDMSYLLTHEFGHHLDFQKHSDQGYNYKQSPLTKNASFVKNISTYGKPTPVDRGAEAYAEAFAEWHHSAGTTKNPAAIAMAKYEGWYQSGVTASAAINTENMLMVDNSINSFAKIDGPITAGDNFEIKNGGKVSNLGKVILPTLEEIAKASKIMAEVLADLEV